MFGNLARKNDSKNIKFGAILTYVTLVFSVLNGLVLTPILLKNIGSSNYGFYSFTLSITSWLPLLTNALTASFIRFASVDEKNNAVATKTTSIYFKIILYFCLIASFIFLGALAILFGCRFELHQYSSNENNLIYLLLAISSINSFSSIFFSFFTLFICFKQRFIFVEIVKLLTALLSFCLKVLLVILTKNVIVILVIDLTITLLFGILTIAFANTKLGIPVSFKIKLKDNKILIKEILIFSSFLLLNNIAEQINNHLDVTILGFFANEESVTTYQLSFTFCSYMANIPVAIATLFIPKINEYYAKGEKEKINDLFLKVSHLQLLFVLLVLGGYIVCGKDFIYLWLDGERNDVFLYSLPLLIIHSLPLTVNVAIEIQRAYNKHKFRAISLVCIAFINALSSALCVIFLPKEYAVLSCVICTVVSKFVGVWILFNIYNYKVIKLPINKYLKDAFISVFKTAFCVIFAIGVNRLLSSNHLPIIVCFLITGITYVICYFFVIIIFDNELKSFLRRKNA